MKTSTELTIEHYRREEVKNIILKNTSFVDGSWRALNGDFVVWYKYLDENRIRLLNSQDDYEYVTENHRVLYSTLNVFQKDLKISKQIADSKWFFLSWKNDPTIKAMLNMLDVIQFKFGEPNDKLFDLLCNENCPVIFHFLPLEQFKLEDENGIDITDQILHLPKVYLIFSYKPKEISKEDFLKYESYMKANEKAFGITTEKGIFKTIPNLTMDGTAIKTIARSNPFVLVLENGKIISKMSVKEFMNTSYIK